MTSLTIKDFDNAMNLGATNKGAVSKLVKAWEAKNDQSVKRAAGLGLMAVSLAACGSSSDDDSDDGDDGDDGVVVTPVSMALSTDNDILTSTDFTTAADTITADQDTYEDGDVIAEGTSGDGDTLTVTTDDDITATPTIVDIENIVFNAAFFAAVGAGLDVDVDGISSGTVTINHSQVGSAMDTATVTNANGVTVVAGDNVDDISVTMNEDAGTIVDAGAATAVAITSEAGDDQVATLVANGDVTVTLADTADTLTDLNVTATEASVVTVVDNANLDTITVDANTTISVATLAVVDGFTVTGAGDLSGGGATADLSGVAVAITVDDGVAATLTVADDASVDLSTTNAAAADFDFLAADDDDSDTDVEQSLTVTLSDDTTDASTAIGGYAITLTDSADDGSNEITTLNLVAAGDLDHAATADGDVGVDLSDNALDTTVNISGAGDIDLLVTVGTGDITINAAALAGALTMAAEDEMVTIVGGAGADTIDVSTLTAGEEITLTGGAGNDTIDGGNADLTGATITGFEIISANTYGFLASQLHNATFIVSDGAAINVNIAATSIDIATIDLSGLTFADATDNVTVNLTAIDTAILLAGQGFTYTGSDAEDSVTGSANADTISGGAGIDTLGGGAGADTISGGAGVDTITGGTGADTVTGGAGNDIFAFADADSGITVATADTITDFTTTEDDIDLAGYLVASAATDYSEADGSAAADFDALVALADAAFANDVDDGVHVLFDALGTGDAYVFFDASGDNSFGTGDTLIILTGVSAAADIISGDFV